MIVLRQKEFNKKEGKLSIGDKARKYLSNKSFNVEIEGNSDLLNKVIKEGSKQRGGQPTILHESGFPGGAYFRGVGPKIEHSEGFQQYLKSLPKEKLDELKKTGLERIKIDKDLKGSSAFLSHEIGHSRHNPGRSKNKLLNLNAKLDAKLRGTKVVNKAGAGNLVAGLVSGYRAGIDEEKDTAGNKILPYLPSTIVNAPTIIEEADASRRGLKLMKKAGANKKQMKSGRKALGYALGSYLVRPAAQLGMGAVGRVAGKVTGKTVKKVKESKE